MSAKVPPKPAKDVVYVDVDDEITGIIDKVENSAQKVVALVLPKRAASLQSIVNMKLLKRSAEDAGKNVVLITNEHALLPLAGAAGLHVAKNLQSLPEVPQMPGASGAAARTEPEEAGAEDAEDEDVPSKFDYSRPVGALVAAHEAENPETIDLDDEEDKPEPAAAKAPKGSKVKVPNFDRFRMMLGLGGLALVALIVFIIMAIFVLPKATVTIKTVSEPVSANFNLTASVKTKSLDAAQGLIPAKLESTDQTGTQQVTATGQQNNGQKATGSVTMSTCVSGSSPQDVPAGTGVSSNGLTYITQQTAHFNPTFQPCGNGTVLGQSNSVDIVATQGGSKYNTSISGASVSGRSGVTADGSASGGTDNIVTVLSQSDVDSAKDKLTGGTSGDDFTKSFIQKLQDQGEYVLTSTLKAGDAKVSASPAVGQPASTATVTIKVSYTVLTVQKSDLSQAIEDKTADQIDKSKQKLNGNFLNDANVTVQTQPSSSSAVLSISESTTAVPIIDTKAVKKLAEGKKAGDIQAAISNWPGVKSVDVNLSPFWVSKAPKKDSKVTVILQEVKDNSANSAP
ncbi:MAG TPA: hypothetical protein VFJ84_02535 [Candidatus Saccharimonadales bacterium]|nr:hypothetical protein [Candidatus Saccharimonadales bacterium]